MKMQFSQKETELLKDLKVRRSSAPTNTPTLPGWSDPQLKDLLAG